MIAPDLKLLPTSDHTEIAILGALLLEPMETVEACRRLRPEMFALDSHQRIYRCMIGMIADGKGVDFTTVRHELDRRREMDSIGGPAYLAYLTEGIPRNLNIDSYVAIVIDKWKRREGMKICNRGEMHLTEEYSAPEDVLASIQSQVFDLMQERAANDDPLVCAYAVRDLEETLDYSKSAMGYSYGNRELDGLTNGMQPGEVTVVGARPKVGKSSLAIQALAANCSQGVPADFFSLEMRRIEVEQRLWAVMSGLPYGRIRRKLLNLCEQQLLRNTALEIAEWPLRIYDDADMTLAQIAAMARLDARRHGVKIVAVDYAQIVNANSEGKDAVSRVSAVSRTLTKLAKKEGAHLMLLSQLRKPTDEGYSKPPNVSQLRETGQIEMDAHVIVLLHRPWDDAAAKISFDAELIVPAQRSGDTGAIAAKFNPQTLTFD